VFLPGNRAADILSPDFWAMGATILGISSEEAVTLWRQACRDVWRSWYPRTNSKIFSLDTGTIFLSMNKAGRESLSRQPFGLASLGLDSDSLPA